jgi:alkaline phosphatase
MGSSSLFTARCLATALVLSVLHWSLDAAPMVSRLTPPSNLFTTGDAEPVVARFLPGQRFDLQATIAPDTAQAILTVTFYLDGRAIDGDVSLTAATAPNLPASATIATLRAFSVEQSGVHLLSVEAIQSDGQVASATGNFEIVRLRDGFEKAKNVIVLIGDGLGIAHRTAARLMLHGAAQGRARSLLAMDRLPYTGIAITHSLNSIVTDSSPGSHCYSTGNKANNNQHGVFPDDTTALFDNPRIELIGEYLSRTMGKTLGVVTTSDVFDATPAAWASHTQSRAAGTGICDQFLDESSSTGLRVILGGGRKWFLPASVAGSARRDSTDYVLADELASPWGVVPGAIDPERDLIGDFELAGWNYVADLAELNAAPDCAPILGLFALSNMNVALDKIDGRRGASTVVDDYGFPNQPMLDEMTEKAIDILQCNDRGFVLMVEAASIDKQAHNMDTERWILDTIEFDRAVDVSLGFAKDNSDTLVIVTADHECAGVNIIGGSRVTDSDLAERAASGGGIESLRRNVVGTYESAGFPKYEIAADGYPVTTDVDFRLLIGYAANGDRFEDWRTNPLPLRDGQQPFNNVEPLSTYPSGPLARDVAGDFRVTGQIHDAVAAHTASDVPVSAYGVGGRLFVGVMDNTDVFFRTMQTVLAGVPAIEDEDDGGEQFPFFIEDFESYAPGSQPTQWLDTASLNRLTEDDSLFSVARMPTGNQAFSTASTATNIHSHFISPVFDGLSGYEFTGRMLMTQTRSGIGVTFFSDYPNSDSYYRLRRYHNLGFEISPHGTTISGGQVDLGIVPRPNVWYQFRIHVADTGTRTEIRARVWAEGSPEPATWQADCFDASATRRVAGTIGCWSFTSGSKFFDDFAVELLD